VKNSNKKFKNFRVNIILRNRNFIILEFLRAIKGFILYQRIQTTSKLDYNVTTYDKFTDTGCIEELQL